MAKLHFAMAHPRMICKPIQCVEVSGRRLILSAAKPPSIAVEPRGALDVREYAPDLLGVGAAAAVEPHAAVAAVKQFSTEMALQHADAMGDGGRSDAEFVRGAHKALVSGCRLEEAEAVEWREGVHGMGNSWPQHFC